MEKTTLKTLISNLNKNDLVQIAFVGGSGGWKPGTTPTSGSNPKYGKTGTYKVLESKTGRGKFGSKVCVLSNQDSEEPVLVIGTSISENILHIKHNDVLYGQEEENLLEREKFISKDLDKARALKEKLLPLLKLNKYPDKIVNVKIDSSEKELNGVFRVKTAILVPGRWGQLKVELTNNENGNNVELWSYRHASVIQDIHTV